ncbi:MAG: baseplate hub structural protein / lysozyme R [Enterobacter phage ENC7]|nr:MAG: baseplate hub structural protein / lysozyme R [Enterobacter phage ENC7]UIW11745.1 MAG: baseplate hub structural protein / lysozyme R [Enterobacter phage ENC25]UIW12003.1 MAG: baseplate hub structural protein / lysozyme R [Enterobacter phage ENC22]
MKFGGNMHSPFFEGVVENVDDPRLLGRVQVRVIGEHPAQKQKSATIGIPVEELPWMIPIQDITSAAISGVGFSPTGIVRGSYVFGVWRDKWHQDGVILGTFAGEYVEKPDIQKGFCDPFGEYPRYVGNDVNILARGGQEGKGSSSVIIRDSNSSIAVNPDDRPLDDIPEDNRPDTGGFTIETMLKQDEGIRSRWYVDSEGYPTIGIGHLLIMEKTRDTAKINAAISKAVGREVTNGTITAEEISALFAQDLAKVRQGISNTSNVREVYVDLNRPRQMAIENMCFQMGVGGVAKFTNALAAMKRKDWQNAYAELRNSTWANQTPGRSSRVAKIVLTGNLESYGVQVPDPEGRSLSAAYNAVVLAASNPEDPFVPGDTRVMFEEPKSSYNAEYPYNMVFESRSGHIQEFDDTPGYERYNRVHPAGSYEEIRPDGTRVVKIVGDDFLIVQQGRKVNIKGNLQVVIEGDAFIYNMGNVQQTVDGNVTEFVRGNVNQTVEGEYVGRIKGNAELTVEKDATVNVDQNLMANVKQNATVHVTEDATVTAKNAMMDIEQDFDVSARNITMQASNNTFIDSGALTKITGGTVQVG